MKRTVLLINPWIYDFSAYDFWNKPIGLLSLASLLRRNGATVYYLDCLDPYHPDMQYTHGILAPKRKIFGGGSYAKQRIARPEPLKSIPRCYHRYGISPEIFLNTLRQLPRPDVVMITSMMTYWYPAVFDTISMVHRTYPGVPVVLGGNYVTLCPYHAQTSGADFCLAGPAEFTIPALMKTLFDEDMPFLPDKGDLDSSPYPAFDLLSHPDQIPILTSRGCPYRCTYCASHLLSGAFCRRDPIRVIDEIEYWHRNFGTRHFSFYDDALLAKPDTMVIPLLKELIRRDLPIDFHCPNGLHLREMTAEISKLIFKARFKTIRFGFETADRQRQQTTGGKVCNDEFIDAVAHLQEAGYGRETIGMYLLCGLPEQSDTEVEESIRFVHSKGARPILAEYSPIPGTALWEEAVAAARYPIDREPLFHNNTLLPCRHDSITWQRYQELKMICRRSIPN
jgi:radical SAM superfamily enzyme YgiQ (UPF0313 family)